MSWSSSLSSDTGANMRLRTRDRPKQLHDNTTVHLISTLNEHQYADAAFRAYNNLRDTPRFLCEALLRPPSEAPILDPASDIAEIEASFSGLSLDQLDREGCSNNLRPGKTSSYFPEKHLEAIRGWGSCLQGLHDRLYASLLGTYSVYEEEITDYMAEQLFSDEKFRARAIQRMKQSKALPNPSARVGGGWSTFETRFCNFECIKKDLAYIHSLYQLGKSGILLGRSVQEITISQKGDAVLEFANSESDSHPVLRFRVLSHMLSETSPLFARIFDSGGSDSGHVLTEGFVPGLPQHPIAYTWSDGAQTRLYRMPQLELNAHGSFELLLHAAHLHNESVPREIAFETFVALAKACMRYHCTSPVEMFVEYRWLPQWVHKAIDDMPDGLLLISYAFGLRNLFTRMSKAAILNVVDEDDLQAKPWPQKMKDRIWAVRMAKMDQVWACCSSALQEYLRGPTTSVRPSGGSHDDDKSLAITDGGVVPSSKPRCPKGDHCCDATNLGWLMILFAQQQILPHIMHSPAVAHLSPPPRRSLNHIFDSLRSIVSPPQGHGGVCDYAPAFRGAVNDIYNSVQGLTLFEVSGQHGWALSRHKADLPQTTLTIRVAPAAPLTLAEVEMRETATADVAIRIMEHVDTWRDLRSVAMVSKTFYAAYYTNSDFLIRRLRAHLNHKMGKANNSLDRNRPVSGDGVEGDGGEGFKKDQQKLLIYDRDDDNSTTTGDMDFTPPPSEVRDEQQRTAKVKGEESEHPLWIRNGEGTEKFLTSEMAVHFAMASSAVVPEGKSLVVMEDKNLREQRDRKVGILQ